ncbi:MAG: CotH kinase family protein [Verrucomicrobia bacterium]|nr:CotH kinase family protein [Verrucomicrobiota bacterium]
MIRLLLLLTSLRWQLVLAASRMYAAELTILPESGFYSTPFEVTMASPSSGGRIFYTTNGAAPSSHSGALYERPITIAGTTVLRAAVVRENETSGTIVSRTYLFTANVLKQTGADFPATWGLNLGQLVPAHYAMDSAIVNHPDYRGQMTEALRSIPSLSVLADRDDWFNPQRGIYANPRESGSDWEHPASVEFFSADSRERFQINGGVRIQGGWNRRPEESPKHSLRLVFKKKYGAQALLFPFFGKTAPAEFDTLILRGGCNNTWLHWNGEERRRGDYLRDTWMRDTQLAMGHPAARGRFVQLYLNGLYWGLYNLCERPGLAFAAAHFGGAKDDYDSRNGDHILAGDDVAWKKLMTLANAGLTNEEAFRSVQAQLDLPGFIDYMMLNFYGANADWDRSSNWYAARRRTPNGKFHFFVWDGERTLETVDANTIEFDDDESPPRLFHKLRANAEFRIMFADRVQRHCFGSGALTPAAAAARYRSHADEIHTAIVAESARWGNYRHAVHQYKTGPYERYTVNEHWQPEIRRLFNDYFPKRTAIVLQQFRERGLYPRIDAPTLLVSAKFLNASAPRGKIHFATNGSDPRLPGGGLSPNATLYEKPVELPAGTLVKARALAGEPGVGEWSALVELSVF